MTENSQPAGTTTIATLRIPMRDGVELSATTYRQTGLDSTPILLVRTPYNEVMARTLPIGPALNIGLNIVVQNCRGTGDSDGEFWPFESETDDGIDTIAWLIRQPWSNGQVCMFGPSYLGMSQLAVSGRQPEGLAAIVPIVTPHSYRDGLVYKQGAMQFGQALGWHILKTAQSLAESADRGLDVAAQFKALGALSSDMNATYRCLPLTDFTAITDVLPSWRRWLSKERDRSYWKSIGFTDSRKDTQVPALHVGGWFDLFLTGTLDNFVTISQHADDVGTRKNQHLIIGPWSHTDQTGVAGELYFGAGSAAAIGLEQQQMRFLRESLDATATSLPAVQIFVMGANRWRTENEWPLARTEWQNWYLGSGGSLNHDGATDPSGKVDFVHDPHDPVPTVGGGTLIFGGIDGGADYLPGMRDQRILDHRHDIARFCSQVLEEDLEVTGPLSATLYASTTANDADFTAKLVDVWPDGRAMGVADGIVRARYRNGMDSPTPVEPGSVYQYTIDMAATSLVFKKGHSIRVEIAGSNFPCYDRNSGTGKLAGEITAEDLTVATQSIFFGADHPSHIKLPVIPQ